MIVKVCVCVFSDCTNASAFAATLRVDWSSKALPVELIWQEAKTAVFSRSSSKGRRLFFSLPQCPWLHLCRSATHACRKKNTSSLLPSTDSHVLAGRRDVGSIGLWPCLFLRGICHNIWNWRKGLGEKAVDTCSHVTMLQFIRPVQHFTPKCPRLWCAFLCMWPLLWSWRRMAE